MASLDAVQYQPMGVQAPQQHAVGDDRALDRESPLPPARARKARSEAAMARYALRQRNVAYRAFAPASQTQYRAPFVIVFSRT